MKKQKFPKFAFNPIIQQQMQLQISGTITTMNDSTISFERQYAKTEYILEFSSLRKTTRSVGIVSTIGRSELKWFVMAKKNSTPRQSVTALQLSLFVSGSGRLVQTIPVKIPSTTAQPSLDFISIGFLLRLQKFLIFNAANQVRKGA